MVENDLDDLDVIEVEAWEEVDWDLPEDFVGEDEIEVAKHRPGGHDQKSHGRWANGDVDDAGNTVYLFTPDELGFLESRDFPGQLRDVRTLSPESQQRVAEIIASAKTEGIVKPIVVKGTDTRRWLHDGHHRYFAARELGIEVPVVGMYGEVAKHGGSSHDQRSHGRRGGSQPKHWTEMTAEELQARVDAVQPPEMRQGMPKKEAWRQGSLKSPTFDTGRWYKIQASKGSARVGGFVSAKYRGRQGGRLYFSAVDGGTVIVEEDQLLRVKTSDPVPEFVKQADAPLTIPTIEVDGIRFVRVFPDHGPHGDEVAKHQGPGPHASGSPQSAHGGGGVGVLDRYDPLSDNYARLKEHYPNAKFYLFFDHPDTAPEVARALVDFARDYPEVAEQITYVAKSIHHDNGAETVIVPENIQHGLTTGSQLTPGIGVLIGANVHRFKNPHTVATEWDLGVYGIVTHELGHALHMEAVRRRRGDDWKELISDPRRWEGFMREMVHTPPPSVSMRDLPDPPNLYAQQNFAEYFAELFTINRAISKPEKPSSMRVAYDSVVDSVTNHTRSLSKHYGPGPHPSGTPQTVHGGGPGHGSDADLLDTTLTQGGATLDPRSRRYRRSGKALSIYPERSRTIDALTKEAIRDYRVANTDLLSKPGHHLGTWFDKDAGVVWLDVSVLVRTPEEAVELAQQHNQKAYFDLDTMEEVPTGGTGEALSKRTADEPGSAWLRDSGGAGLGRGVGGLRGGDSRRDRGAAARGLTLPVVDFLAKHLPGGHDQKTHGQRGGVGGSGRIRDSKTELLSGDDLDNPGPPYELKWGNYTVTRHSALTLDNHGWDDAAKRKAKDDWQKLYDESELVIRTSEQVAHKVVYSDERFLSQFESLTSNGLFDPSYRRFWENKAFGTPDDYEFPDFLSPIYGYLDHPVAGKETIRYQGADDVLYDAASQYGDVKWILDKDKVSNRATFTWADSLDNAERPVTPTEIKSRDYPVEYTIKPSEPHLLNRALTRGSSTYFEAQFHGGVSLDDVKGVHFTEGLSNRSIIPDLVSRGIEVWIEGKRVQYNPNQLSFDDDVAKTLLPIVAKHLPGQHDQKRHNPHKTLTGGGTGPVTDTPEAYQERMVKKLAELGLNQDVLEATLEDALDRGNPEHADWYPMIHEVATKWAERYGVSVEQAAGVIAAVSPERTFFNSKNPQMGSSNIMVAKNILETLAKDEPFEMTAELRDTFNAHRVKKGLDPTNFKPGIYRPSEVPFTPLLVATHPTLLGTRTKSGLTNTIKAVMIARGADIDEVLGGPKIRSFYNNIVAPDDDRFTTIDTWMYRAMVPKDHKMTLTHPIAGRREFTLGEYSSLETAGGNPLKKKSAQDVFQSSPGKVMVKGQQIFPGGVGVYPIFNDAVRAVAKRRRLSPNAVQAIVWEVARTDAGYEPSLVGFTPSDW